MAIPKRPKRLTLSSFGPHIPAFFKSAAIQRVEVAFVAKEGRTAMSRARATYQRVNQFRKLLRDEGHEDYPLFSRVKVYLKREETEGTKGLELPILVGEPWDMDVEGDFESAGIMPDTSDPNRPPSIHSNLTEYNPLEGVTALDPDDLEEN